ncbi:hypothetical protein NDU88_004558 [Pleurodeles waltl]|uniref:Uncharacterized protein n=1 Tax=Pleurodeles waltl TaxID=8319 RepID=A0AAV7SJ38_PLEWA|nr:hypothetical protein NDU88_004558 [Pleurodeles waltl]
MRRTPLHEWVQQESAPVALQKVTYLEACTPTWKLIVAKQRRKKEDARKNRMKKTGTKETQTGDAGPRDPGKEEDTEKEKEDSGNREERGKSRQDRKFWGNVIRS